MRFWQVTVAACVALVATAEQPDAAEKKIQIPGIYSDLYYNREGGDLIGTELFIVPAGQHGYVAFVQSWQGESNLPLAVPVQVDEDKIMFDVPAPSFGEGQYNGRISKTGFDGTWTHPLASGGFAKDPMHLKRKKSYWQ